MARLANIEDMGDYCIFSLSNDATYEVGVTYPQLERHLQKAGVSPLGQDVVYSVNQVSTRELRLCCQLIANKLPASHQSFAEFLRQTTKEMLAIPYRLVWKLNRHKPVFQLSHGFHFQARGRVYQHVLSWQGQDFTTQVNLDAQTVQMKRHPDQRLFVR